MGSMPPPGSDPNDPNRKNIPCDKEKPLAPVDPDTPEPEETA